MDSPPPASDTVRHNLYRLTVWVRWELLFFFLITGLLSKLFQANSESQPDVWVIALFTIAAGLNFVYHRFARHLAAISWIFLFQFGIDVFLVSLMSVFSVPDAFWGLYVPVIVLAAFVMRQKSHLWRLTIWIGLCYGVACWNQYSQMPYPDMTALTGLMRHWLWITMLLAAIALLCTQLMGYTHERIHRLSNESVIEPLTGLYQRRYFLQRLQSELERSRRYGRIFSVIMIDLDNLAAFNDAYGHAEGDRLLQAVARILRANLRRSPTDPPAEIDIACRYESDQFALLLPELSLEFSTTSAEQLREVIQQELALLAGEIIRTQLESYVRQSIRLTVSIGIASFPIHADTVENLIRAAGAALYAAKRQGKNQVVSATSLL